MFAMIGRRRCNDQRRENQYAAAHPHHRLRALPAFLHPDASPKLVSA